jgi:hypothetical protein
LVKGKAGARRGRDRVETAAAFCDSEWLPPASGAREKENAKNVDRH